LFERINSITAFNLCNPTRILFGTDTLGELKSLVAPGTKVLVLYGGGGIKRNAIHGQIMTGGRHHRRRQEVLVMARRRPGRLYPR